MNQTRKRTIGKPGEKFKSWIDPDYLIGNKGTIYSQIVNCEIGTMSDFGYHQFFCKTKWIRSHIAVYRTWKGEIPEGYEINHENMKRWDNRVENLTLVTHKENMQHQSRMTKIKQLNHHTKYQCCKYNQNITDSTKLGIKNLPRGEKHHKFTGYYYVNEVRFATAKEPANLLSISTYRLRELCKSNRTGFRFEPTQPTTNTK